MQVRGTEDVTAERLEELADRAVKAVRRAREYESAREASRREDKAGRAHGIG